MKLKSVEELLSELEDRKTSLDSELRDITSQKKIIERLFPKEFNYKTKFQLENKVDLLVRFYELILKYNNQYSSIIKDQLSFTMKRQEITNKGNNVSAVAAKLFDVLNENKVDLSKMSEELSLEVSEFEEREKELVDEDDSPALPNNIEEAVQTINNALSSYDFERNNSSEDTMTDISDDEAIILENEAEELSKQKLNKEILKELKEDSEIEDSKLQNAASKILL